MYKEIKNGKVSTEPHHVLHGLMALSKFIFNALNHKIHINEYILEKVDKGIK